MTPRTPAPRLVPALPLCGTLRDGLHKAGGRGRACGTVPLRLPYGRAAAGGKPPANVQTDRGAAHCKPKCTGHAPGQSTEIEKNLLTREIYKNNKDILIRDRHLIFNN